MHTLGKYHVCVIRGTLGDIDLVEASLVPGGLGPPSGTVISIRNRYENGSINTRH